MMLMMNDSWRAILSDEVVPQIGWTLVHSVWQGAIAAGALAATLVFMKSASSPARYAASCMALLAIVVAGVVTFGLEKSRLAPRVIFVDAPPIGQPNAMENNRSAEADPTKLVTPSQTRNNHWEIETALPWAVSAWAMGVLAISIWQIAGWMRIQRWKLQAVGEASKWEPILRQMKDRMQIGRVVRLVEAKVLKTPAVVGVIRPVILVPMCAMSGLSLRRWRRFWRTSWRTFAGRIIW